MVGVTNIESNAEANAPSTGHSADAEAAVNRTAGTQGQAVAAGGTEGVISNQIGADSAQDEAQRNAEYAVRQQQYGANRTSGAVTTSATASTGYENPEMVAENQAAAEGRDQVYARTNVDTGQVDSARNVADDPRGAAIADATSDADSRVVSRTGVDPGAAGSQAGAAAAAYDDPTAAARTQGEVAVSEKESIATTRSGIVDPSSDPKKP